VFVRKTDPKAYDSTIELARGRFEAKLKEDKDINQRSMDEYQMYMDETTKFQELKMLKEA
jgi:hypothetical protein